jgi:1,4-dihydroxy-2-naphthoyl-CoA hydrolase
VLLEEQLVAQGCLHHVAIDAQTRHRCALPDGVDRWLEASSLGRIQPL